MNICNNMLNFVKVFQKNADIDIRKKEKGNKNGNQYRKF